MNRVLVIGSINMDMVVRAERWPLPGETIRGHGFLLSPGGKGANQAVAAAKLGAEAHLAACTGDDLFGREIRSNLERFGVDIAHVRACAGISTGVAVITVCEGDNTIVLDEGANGGMTPDRVEAIAREIRAADVLMLQNEIPLASTLRAREIARGSGCRVLCNPAPAPAEPLPDAFYADLDFLTPNEHEAERMLGRPVRTVAQAFEALDAFRAMGVRHPLITLGGEGCAYFDGARNRHDPAIPSDVVDTTAAGDTFSAGIAVAISQGKGIEEAVSFATRAAHVTVQRMGAQDSIPWLHELA